MRNRLLILCFLFGAFAISCCKDNDEPRVGKSSAIFNPDKTYGTVTDIDGNVYKTITIGTQTWMAENLRVTHYQNGDPIPNVTDNDQWAIQTTGALCSYNNTMDIDTIATYGILYNGYAATDGRNIAPEGWHIPTNDEWTTLSTFIDAGDGVINDNGSSIAGGRMKEIGTTHWAYPNRFADNSSGFTGISNGWRETYLGKFMHKGFICGYWSATVIYPPFPLTRIMSTDFGGFTKSQLPVTHGLSIRCIKN